MCFCCVFAGFALSYCTSSFSLSLIGVERSLSGPMPNSAIRNCSPAPLDTWASGCVPQTAVVVPVRVVIWWKLVKNRAVFAKFHHRDARKYTHILREQTKNPKLVRYYDSSGCLVTYSDGLFVDRFSQKSPDTLQYGWRETANDQLSVRFDRTKKNAITQLLCNRIFRPTTTASSPCSVVLYYYYRLWYFRQNSDKILSA